MMWLLLSPWAVLWATAASLALASLLDYHAAVTYYVNSVAMHRHASYTIRDPTREFEMKAIMSPQQTIPLRSEDMMLSENIEPGDFGACRRR